MNYNNVFRENHKNYIQDIKNIWEYFKKKKSNENHVQLPNFPQELDEHFSEPPHIETQEAPKQEIVQK